MASQDSATTLTDTLGQTRSVAFPPSLQTLLRAYYALTKPRIMLLLLITTLAALLIADRQYPVSGVTLIRLMLATLLGGGLASGGASALNSYIDRDIDEVMNRTCRRPIPAGTLSARHVLLFGLLLTILSAVVMFVFTNTLAALLTLAGNAFYVLIYTRWLKRTTTQNIVIGGIAGAIPPLVGWAAVTGSLALPALLLFVIVTYWTPAHFWALAILNRRDYARAHIPMLPSVTSERHATWHILIYTLLVVVSTLLLFISGDMGVFYLIAALGLGGGFLWQAMRLLRHTSARYARNTFMYSNYYLAALFAAMVLDRVFGI